MDEKNKFSVKSEKSEKILDIGDSVCADLVHLLQKKIAAKHLSGSIQTVDARKSDWKLIKEHYEYQNYWILYKSVGKMEIFCKNKSNFNTFKWMINSENIVLSQVNIVDLLCILFASLIVFIIWSFVLVIGGFVQSVWNFGFLLYFIKNNQYWISILTLNMQEIFKSININRICNININRIELIAM